MDKQKFTHFDQNGHAVMVDVTGKTETDREATAVGRIRVSSQVYDAVVSGNVEKGDVLGVARVAGIMGTKKTSELIPMCHNLNITRACLDFKLYGKTREIEAVCSVSTAGKTGVEMEALTGVNVALLTIYDMCKAIDKQMEIRQIYLLKKSGGKSGHFHNSNHIVERNSDE